MLVTTYLCHFYMSIATIRMISPEQCQTTLVSTVSQAVTARSLSEVCHYLYNKLHGHPTKGWMKEEDTKLLTKIHRAPNDPAYSRPPDLNLIISF